MKKLLFVFALLSCFSAKAQFPSIDSLLKFTDRYIRNSAVEAFTNLRLNTVIHGLMSFVKGVDSVYALNDSTLRLVAGPKSFDAIIRGVYDYRRKVDSIYVVDDSTLNFTINNETKSVVIRGATIDLRNQPARTQIEATDIFMVTANDGTIYQVPRSVLLSMVNSSSYGGTAIPSTNPGTPPSPIFYTASTPGTYTNFGGISISSNEVLVFLTWDESTWTKQVIPISVEGLDSVIAKTQETILPSINLLNKETIVSGSFFSTGGTISSNVNWRRTTYIPVKPSTTYTFWGFNSSFAGNEYKTTSGGFCRNIGNNTGIKNTITFTTTDSTYAVGLNISSTGSVDYNNTAQLEEGDTSTVYQIYGKYYLDGGSITEIPDVVYTPQLNIVEEKQNAIRENYINYTHYAASASGYTKLPSIFTLTAVGDYVEAVYRINNIGSNLNWLGVIGTHKESGAATIINLFGPNSGTQMNLRGNASGAYITWTGLPNLFDWNKIKLQVVSGGWELFVNDISYGVKAKVSDLIISAVASAYPGNYSNADVRSLIVSTAAEGELSLTDLATLTTNVNAPLVSSPIETGSTVNQNVFVSYNPTGFSGRPVFYIYGKMKGQERYYIRYTVQHEYDMSDAVYTDQYRLAGAALYSYVNGSMIAESTEILTASESESVYHQEGRSDFAGGWHGDEIKSEVYFFVNGVRLTSTQLSSAFDLLPAEEFKYLQKSTVHEAPTGGVFAPGHPAQADKIKETSFTSSGYYTFNKYTWLQAISIDKMYHGLSTISLPLASEAYNDLDFTLTALNQSSTHRMLVPAHTINYSNSTTKLGAKVSSRIVSPAAYDVTAQLDLFDSPSYAKYYRSYPSTVSTIINDVWSGELTAEFFLKQ